MEPSRQPRDWTINGEEFFGVPRLAVAIRWYEAGDAKSVVLLQAALRQHERSVEFQLSAQELAGSLGEAYSLRWLAARLHTLDYDGMWSVVRGRTRMNLEHLYDFTQAVSDPRGTVTKAGDSDAR